MKKKQSYITPEIQVFETCQEHLLQQASGQHKDADNGGTLGDAKQGFFDEDDLDEDDLDEE